MKTVGAIAGLLVVLREHAHLPIILMPDNGDSIPLNPGDARFLAKILNDAADRAEEKKS
jgi:hypothetical protein